MRRWEAGRRKRVSRNSGSESDDLLPGKKVYKKLQSVIAGTAIQKNEQRVLKINDDFFEAPGGVLYI